MKKRWLFILSIVLLGVVMRSTFTTIPVVIDNVANTFGLPVSQLGILTTLPLLTFAVVSPTTTFFTKRFGIEKTLLAALLFVLVGSIARIVSAPMLFIGTILVGIGIAFINVLLPAT
jgi:CP family cyanate transporter-like MFS transporter